MRKQIMHAHNHHCHSHNDHNHHASASFNSAFLLAISLNFLFVLVEVFYSYRAHSMSLIADAVHNLGDVLALLFSWSANVLLTKQAKQAYSYGYKRATILASMTNALILIISSVLIAYESINKLIHATQVNGSLISMVALLGIFINAGTALLFLRGAHSDLNIKSAFLHLLYDAIIAAGVVVSGVLIYYTNKMWIDPVVGLLVVASILWGTWGLLRDSINLILDATPAHINFEQVKKFLQHLPNVEAVHDLHIWGLSTRQTALTVHLVFAARSETQVDYHEINNVLKEQFNIDHVTIQVEVKDNDFVCIRSERCC